MDNKLVFVALGLGLISRVAMLFQPLWYDEAFTLRLARLSLPDMLLATAFDFHPALWYVIEWLTIRALGEWALRIPALLFGLLSVWFAHEVFKGLNLSRPARRTAIILMSLSPFLIYYSAEARMYALLLAVILLAAWSALNRDWLLLGLTLALGMLTHNLMALYIPSLVTVYLLQGGRDLIKMALSFGMPYAIWLPVLVFQVQSVTGSYWVLPLTAGRLVYIVHQVLFGSYLASDLILPVAIIGLALLALGVWVATNERRWSLVSLALGPLLVGAILSLVARPVLIDRVMIGSAPFLLALVGLGWGRLQQQAGIWAVTLGGVSLAVLLFSYPVKPDYTEYYGQLPISQGDHCYHLTPGSNVLASIYLPQCDHYTFSAPHKPNGLSPETIAVIGLEERSIERVPQGTIWLFHTEEPYSQPGEFLERERILNQYGSAEYLLFENEFVAMRAWRLDR